MSLNLIVTVLTHFSAGRNRALAMMSSRPTSWLALLFATAFLFSPESAHAQSCSAESLRGTFGYTVTGTITTAFGPLVPGPFAAVGKIAFDGYGHVTTVRSLSDNGHVLTNDAGAGTYVLSSDCTGSFNITVGPTGNTTVLNLNIVLDDTNQLRGLVTNAGTVLVFEGRKQLPILYL